MHTILKSSILLGSLLLQARTQFPPPPEGLTILKSQFDGDITISYKEVSVREHNASLKLNSVAGHLRNHSRGEVIFRLCPPSSRHPRRLGPKDRLSNKYIFLVLRGEKGS